MFQWLYGAGIVRPEKGFVANGKLSNFNQNEFFPLDSLTSSMSRTGMIYVPKGCQNKTQVCKLHIAFHGCMASQ